MPADIIETHPHLPFIPTNATVLILGSFPGRHHLQADAKTEWFYGAPRNQFWQIMRGVYNEALLTPGDKKNCFEKHAIAITAIFLKIRRKENNNADSSIEVVEYNDKVLGHIFNNYDFKTVFFTSHFVEKEFKKLFPAIKNTETLPSPSPRYAKMSLSEKIIHYKNKLP